MRLDDDIEDGYLGFSPCTRAVRPTKVSPKMGRMVCLVSWVLV